MNKKESIISAALELLVENGIHATPMSAIAKSANTGMGTIYNYFPNKEILINAIYVIIKQKEESILLNAPKEGSIKAQFEQYYRIVTDFYLDNPLYFKFIQQLQSSPIITKESKKEGYKAVESVIQLLKDGQEAGLVKEIKIEELLQFLGGAIISYLRWVTTYEINNSSINNQLRLVWDAIKK
ncbi:TetR/AcrR family transcriptional regulator [Flammeovirgaceae bacterium SG7u.111]|nr:TetR/AcrR family transcriptional regulator [Flammeovirgaceae bacterium SG7u.132]WPO37514.1 TetR/AcrR family transcriptional regulator [Flammeovirgaceae bacterium SG7u.111]